MNKWLVIECDPNDSKKSGNGVVVAADLCQVNNGALVFYDHPKGPSGGALELVRAYANGNWMAVTGANDV